ncbi:MAG: photosystem II protein PsbQ [Microcoleaceae cyanobacterium]
MMKRYRSILACLLALVAVFVVSCGSAEVAAPPTYSTTQLQQIQKYNTNILALRDRMTTELQTSIAKSQWIEVDNFVHGPLGTMLREMNYLVRNLLPDEQPPARKLAKELFNDLVKVGEAAEVADKRLAQTSYQQALQDLDSFLELVPSLDQAASS